MFNPFCKCSWCQHFRNNYGKIDPMWQNVHYLPYYNQYYEAENMRRNPYAGRNGLINPFVPNPPPPQRPWRSLFSSEVRPELLSPTEQVAPIERYFLNPLPPAEVAATAAAATAAPYVQFPRYVSPSSHIDLTEDEDDEMGQNPRSGLSGVRVVAGSCASINHVEVNPRQAPVLLRPTNQLKRKSDKQKCDRTKNIKRLRREERQRQMAEPEAPREVVRGPPVMQVAPQSLGHTGANQQARRVTSSTVTSTSTKPLSAFHRPPNQ